VRDLQGMEENKKVVHDEIWKKWPNFPPTHSE